MLWPNVERRINAAARLLENAEIPNIGNTAKSSYYRSAIILLCTVVEGMVYEVVKRNTAQQNNIVYKNISYESKHKIPANVTGGLKDFYICEKKEESIEITDTKRIDFGKLNIYLKNHNIVNKQEYTNLNWVRQERNKIHIQDLTTPDTGYTKLKINKIGKIISFLESKIT